MLLACTFLNNSFLLEEKKQKGPDIRINKEKIIWIEAISPDKGKGDNRVKAFEDSFDAVPVEAINFGGGSVDELNEPKILRIRSAISKKIEKYNKYIEKNIIKKEDCYIVAINGESFDGWQMDINLIMGAVFGLGNMYFKINSLISKLEGPYYQNKSRVFNKNLSPVDVDIFKNNKHEGISAVMYNGDGIVNNPCNIKDMGNSFITVLNPFAKNRLPENFINFGSIWKLESIERFKIIRIK